MAWRRPFKTQIRIRMSYLLFPGRHLVNTTFQEQYLKRVLTEPPAAIARFHRWRRYTFKAADAKLFLPSLRPIRRIPVSIRFHFISAPWAWTGLRDSFKIKHLSVTGCWGFRITDTQKISPPSPSRKLPTRASRPSSLPRKIASSCAPHRKSSGFIKNSVSRLFPLN